MLVLNFMDEDPGMWRPEQNPRNQLESVLRQAGLVAENHIEVVTDQLGEQSFRARVTLEFPDGVVVSEEGGQTIGKKPSIKLACQAVLDQLQHTHPYLFTSWEELRVEAQAGDALIKLAAYLSDAVPTAAAASDWLQALESNENLAQVFDRWKAVDHPELTQWGTWLSDDRKGTIIEALIWRQYGARILSASARAELAGLFAGLDTGTL